MGPSIMVSGLVFGSQRDRGKVYFLEVSPPNKASQEPEVEISYCSFGIIETPVEEKPANWQR